MSVCERNGRVFIEPACCITSKGKEVNSSLDRINRNSVMSRLMDIAVTLVLLSEQLRKQVSNFK